MEHEDFLMDVNLLLIQIDELSARVHTLYETWRSRLAHPSNQPAAEVVQLVLEEQTAPARKRTYNGRHYWTAEDDQLLVSLRDRGTEFSRIAELLNCGVTDKAAANRYRRLAALAATS
jgi:hypothetical protein